MNEPLRLFVTLGPGDIVLARRRSATGATVDSTSIAYSEQFIAYCKERGFRALAISANPRRDTHIDGVVTLENRPKPLRAAGGAGFHISQLLYAGYLCWRALRFRADLAIIDSGTTHYFFLLIFRLARIRVIANLHNTLWPRGYPPKGRIARTFLQLDALFFAHGASGAIGVSPECERQVHMQSHGRIPFFQYRCQFREEGFIRASPYRGGPFTLCFSGRAERNKGLFDLLKIGDALRQRSPVPVRIEVCGDGPSLQEFRELVSEKGLANVINVNGRLARRELVEVYGRSHAMIIPTRSDFCEGVPAVCAEAMFARLPVIASDATNSLDVVGPASVQVATNDVNGFVEAILQLVNLPGACDRLCAACSSAAEQFQDRGLSMPAAIDHMINSLTGQAPLTGYDALFSESGPAQA